MAEGSGLPQIIFLMATIILHSQNNLLLWDSFGIYDGVRGGGGWWGHYEFVLCFSFYCRREGEMRDVI